MLFQARNQGENLWAHVTRQRASHGAIVAAIARIMISRVKILQRARGMRGERPKWHRCSSFRSLVRQGNRFSPKSVHIR